MTAISSNTQLTNNYDYALVPLALSLVPLKLCQEIIQNLHPTSISDALSQSSFEPFGSDKKTLQSALYYTLYDAFTLPSDDHVLNYSLSLIEKTCLVISSLTAIAMNFFYLLASDMESFISYFFENEPIIEFKDVKKPDDLLIGTATCTYQDSGNFPNSQWTSWQNTLNLPEENRSDRSANLLTLYQNKPDEVIARLKALKVTSYRFSVEWSQIETEDGKFDDDAMQIYVDFCNRLKENGIEPMITFHHFSEPIWFHESLSFNNDENGIKFARFCDYATGKLKEHVQYFCTINEPNIEAFSRYVRGAFSPGKIARFHEGLKFLSQALKAHNLAFDAIKKQHPEAKVGFTHQYLRFIGGNSITTFVADILTRFVNDATLRAFKERQIRFNCPFFHPLSIKIDEIKADFIGVQYYTRPILGFLGSIGEHHDSPMTLMPFREDPEGLKEAIINVHLASKKPIIVTENGISTEDQAQKARYLNRALNAFMEAKEILKENLQGYYLWAFTRNFEWDLGMKPQNFGAYTLIEQNGNITLSDRPSGGIEPFLNFSD